MAKLEEQKATLKNKATENNGGSPRDTMSTCGAWALNDLGLARFPLLLFLLTLPNSLAAKGEGKKENSLRLVRISSKEHQDSTERKPDLKRTLLQVGRITYARRERWEQRKGWGT